MQVLPDGKKRARFSSVDLWALDAPEVAKGPNPRRQGDGPDRERPLVSPGCVGGGASDRNQDRRTIELRHFAANISDDRLESGPTTLHLLPSVFPIASDE